MLQYCVVICNTQTDRAYVHENSWTLREWVILSHREIWGVTSQCCLFPRMKTMTHDTVRTSYKVKSICISHAHKTQTGFTREENERQKRPKTRKKHVCGYHFSHRVRVLLLRTYAKPPIVYFTAAPLSSL